MGRGRDEWRVPRTIEPVVRDDSARSLTLPRLPIFDLDGTLLDADAALSAPFVALGIQLEQVTFGLVLEEECARLGITVDDYVAHYDDTVAEPYPGVDELITALDRWAVCSNKKGAAGRAEIARCGWTPDLVMFTDDFGGPKSLTPMLQSLAVEPSDVVFVGDTEHDRACAHAVGCDFALATWNPRASALPGDFVLRRPLDLLDLLDDRNRGNRHDRSGGAD